MSKKIFLGGLAGGIVVFVVLSFWHVATHVGDTGIRNLPGEDVLAPAMRSAIHDSGFYFFPGIDMSPGKSKEQQQAEQARWDEKFRQGPTGILIFHPGGAAFSFGKALAIQFVICLVSAFLIAWMLGMAAGGMQSFGSRVLFVALASLFAGIFVNLPLWNWYGFPMDYIVANIGMSVSSWLIAGLAMAKIIK